MSLLYFFIDFLLVNYVLCQVLTFGSSPWSRS